MLGRMDAEPDEVRIAEVTSHAGRVAAADLLAEIWGLAPSESPFPADLMTALQHAGGCVLAAVTPDDHTVGVTVGLAGGPRSTSVYSYVAGVAPSFAGRGLGRRLKIAQRDWALERGADTLTWTYDPLIRRNAHFNLNRLGARATQFVPDYYPPMLDAVNQGDLPDRFVIEWLLDEEPGGRGLPPGSEAAPVVLAEHSGASAVRLAGVDLAAAGVVRAWIPSDIEALRARDAGRGRAWRLAAREVFTAVFEAGFVAVGVDSGGHYVFAREA